MCMQILHREYRLCECCMEEHEVKTVRVKENMTFKDEYVEYIADYFYCDYADEYYMDEDMITNNDIRMKDAYRKKMGLLTSKEICGIRVKYGISQGDLCTLLGWGGKTITRYESHQVQDKAHDTILKKLDHDPEWFIDLLTNSERVFPTEALKKYYEKASLLYKENHDEYLRKAIEAEYANFYNKGEYNGNAQLSLKRVVDSIRYFSNSSRVNNLYKVKLMKLLWYADSLSFKKRGYAITGLVYKALPMGAVPIGHDSIINLKGITCEEVDMGDGTAYHFLASENKEYEALSEEDKEILDVIIQKLGKMSKDEIVTYMHKEEAYKQTPPREIISFKYAENLLI